jgi:Fe2+ or Zn2+ uptake regulation protein
MKLNSTKTLSKHHLKVTETRKALIDLIKGTKKPLDASFIVSNLQKKLNIDRATVFRILNVLSKHGILRKLEFGEGKARYEFNNNDHHHFICEKCGLIDDIYNCNINSFEEKISSIKNIHIFRHSLEFYGFCDNCFKKSQNNII